MKILLSLLLITTCYGCSKQVQSDNGDGYTYINGQGLAGKWVAVTHYGNNGSSMIVTPLSSTGRFIIEFGADSTLQYTGNVPFHDYVFTTYTTVLPRFIKANSPAAGFTANWTFGFVDNNQDLLQLSFVQGAEPTYYELKRIK